MSILPKWPARLRKPGLPELVCVTLALACLVLPEWWTLSRNRSERQKELHGLLQMRLESAENALREWASRTRGRVDWRASQPELLQAVRGQAALVSRPELLADSRYLDQIRKYFAVPAGAAGRSIGIYRDFLIVTREGLVIAAADDQWIGQHVPLPANSALRSALDGEASLSKLGVPDPNGLLETRALDSNIVAAAPIRLSEGPAGAVLAFRLDVQDALRRLTTAASSQIGGNLYAYTAAGAWLQDGPATPSGYLTDQPRQAPPTVQELLDHIVAADPGTATLNPPAPMHARTIFNLEGYRGYSRRDVIGASSALPEIGIGLIAEFEGSEAYRSVHRTRWTLIGLAMILAFGVLLIVLNQTSGAAIAAPPRASTARNSAAWAILIVSLAATGVTWWATKSKVDQYDRTRFEQKAERIRDDLLGRVERYGESLRSVRASFEAFGHIETEQWNDFVSSLNLSGSFPGFGYVAFIENVPESELARFLESSRDELGKPFQIHPEGARLSYYPILYTAPTTPNRNQLGFDVGSSEAVRPALERARDTGQITVSNIVPDEILAGDETGVLMLDPVYRGGSTPDTEEGRRAATAGWVAAFVRTPEMIKNLVSSNEADIDFEVFDGTKLNRQFLLYDEDGVPQAGIERNTSRFHETLLVDIGGRQWTLSFSSTSAFDLPITQNHPAQVLVGGLAISVLLFDIALVLSSTRSRALAIAELMTRKVRESEARVRAVIDYAHDGIVTFDEAGNVHTFNPGAEKLYGYTTAEARGLRIEDLVPSYRPPATELSAEKGLVPAVRRITQGQGWEYLCRRKDGSTFPAELTISRMQPGDRIMYTAMVRDISERKVAERALRESEARYALAARAANDGLWDWNLGSGEIYYSPRWKAMLGIDEEALVDSPEVWFSRVHPDDRTRLQTSLQDHLDGRTTHFESEHRVMHRDGTYRWMLSRGIAVRDEAGHPVRIAGSQADITARKHAERQLLYDALHDPLTGLPNRNYFMGQLERATNEAHRRNGRTFGILFLDVDRFKLVNDSLGHFIGDQLLISIADRLKICLRPGDTIARLGGDEFAVLVENLKDVGDATHVADRIQKELAMPFLVGGQEIFAAVSIGITLSTPGIDSAEDLLRDADTAMYRAKAQGRSRYELFDEGMHTRAVEHLRLETDLRRAVERNEFLVHYQPIVSLRTGEITRCEALIRWQHPERGLVLPGEFIPLAEETGLIIQMSAWLMRTACAQVKSWEEQGLPPIRLAVNISPRQLKQENLFDTVSQALYHADLRPERLELELTESALMESAEDTIKPLVELYAKGVHISLDDFGTGYSSLMYLRRFPISNLKIDASFVRDITTDPGDAAIASGLIALAHSLDLKVIAEGVETWDQLEFLRQKNCDEVQGHFIDRPTDAVGFTEILRRRAKASMLPLTRPI